MGFGDEIMATGMARGARERGKRVAFGDGKRIIWSHWSAEIFRGNRNVAAPGTECIGDLQWIAHYKGHRAYNRAGGNGWIWNYDFRPTPGEIFFDQREIGFARGAVDAGFVLIEPNAPVKTLAPNKQWAPERFQAVANKLSSSGLRVVQPIHVGARHRLSGVEFVHTNTFREALAVLSRAALFIGHEGGMHHGAAAVSVPAVVIFGGFIPPAVTGYDGHANLAAGGEACGSTRPCGHCRRALDVITVDQVTDSAVRLLDAS